MNWQMYWPNWWKLWPSWDEYYVGEASTPEDPKVLMSHVFCFGPFQSTWYETRESD
jgi:hypothetical protein